MTTPTAQPPEASSTSAAPAGEAMLIDRYLPVFDVTLVEHLVVNADLPRTWQALLDTDLLQIHTPLLDAAFWVRGLPERINERRGRTGPPAPPPPSLRLGDSMGDAGAGMQGWLLLGTIEPRELTLGAVGKFWQPTIEWSDVSRMTPQQFADLDDPRWGRIAANFSLRPYGQRRTLLSYEARTAVPGAAERRRFARYWRLVSPFVGHIMRAALREVKRGAEAGVPAPQR